MGTCPKSGLSMHRWGKGYSFFVTPSPREKLAVRAKHIWQVGLLCLRHRGARPGGPRGRFWLSTGAFRRTIQSGCSCRSSRGWHFVQSLLIFSFPVTEIKCLCPCSESVESCRFTAKHKCILEARSQALVIASVDGLIIIACEGHVLIEFNVVMGNVMDIFHIEVVQLGGHRCNRIRLSKSGLESVFEVILSMGIVWKVVIREAEVWFIPSECCSFKPQDCISDFNLIIGEIVRAAPES